MGRELAQLIKCSHLFQGATSMSLRLIKTTQALLTLDIQVSPNFRFSEQVASLKLKTWEDLCQAETCLLTLRLKGSQTPDRDPRTIHCITQTGNVEALLETTRGR